VTPIPYIMPKKPKLGINIEYYGDMGNKKIIEPNLKNISKNYIYDALGIYIPINELWDKSFTNPKMLQWGQIPL